VKYNPSVTGIQGQIFLDQFNPTMAFSSAVSTIALPSGTLANPGITSSFSSKSEGALMRSVNGQYLTYIGYQAAAGLQGVSNSYTPGSNLAGNTSPTYNREVALITNQGSISLTPETNAYSGDNPRAAITVNGKQFYMAGNADSTIAKDGTGPGTTIGARYGTPGSNTSIQLGKYFAADRPEESAKQHVKDNNWRGIGIYNGNLYVSKGSGGNGDDGVFQVHQGTGNGLPTGTGNTITALFSAQATNPDGSSSKYLPFGFFFANPTTLYVADEGPGTLTPDPLAGLEKWSLVNGVWQLDYTLQNGLNLDVNENVAGYPVPTATTGLRNLTGVVNPDGTVTLYAITAQVSTISGGEPDPTRLVAITDRLSATTLPGSESFTTLEESGAGEIFRGVALAPVPEPATLTLLSLGGAVLLGYRWKRRAK
jgi:hypothetical protein